ncbi:PEP-CTERM sorting domain-containing protein [Phragmitibacter flavus]|nr:PEP-CTERM sorting domain-containing protein [Phragmitibacter flavus]
MLGLMCPQQEAGAAVVWQSVAAPSGFYNTDIVYENDGSPAVNGSFGSRYFYENGLQATTPLGLVSTGAYSHNFESYLGMGGTVQFQLGSYADNQVRKTTSASAVSVFDVVDGQYDFLAFVASVGNNNAGLMLNYTVTYSDATTLIGSAHVLDWGVSPVSGSPNELFNVGRANVYSTGTFTPDGAAQTWSAFAYLVPVDSMKTVTSFSYTAGAVGTNSATGEMAFFALSTGVVPEPGRMVLLMMAGLMGVMGRRRG